MDQVKTCLADIEMINDCLADLPSLEFLTAYEKKAARYLRHCWSSGVRTLMDDAWTDIDDNEAWAA